MVMFLWVTVKGQDWEERNWVGRRIIRMKGGYVTLQHVISEACKAALYELEMHQVVFSDKLHFDLKLTLSCPKDRYVFLVDEPSRDGKPLNLVWEPILPDVNKGVRTNG